MLGDSIYIKIDLDDGRCFNLSAGDAEMFAEEGGDVRAMAGGRGFLATVLERHTSPPRSLRIFPPPNVSTGWVEYDDPDVIDRFAAMAEMLGDGDDIGEEMERLYFLLQPVAKEG